MSILAGCVIYDKARRICNEKLIAQLRTKHQLLESVVKTFIDNTHQVFRLSNAIKSIFYYGKRYQAAENYTLFTLTGKPFLPWNALDVAPYIAKLQVGRTSLLQTGKMPDGTNPELAWASTLPDRDDASLVDELFSGEPFGQLLMSMQVVAAYTVFETLFGDLWEAAVNIHPDTLAELKGNAKPSEQSRKEGKTIRLSDLQKSSFDIKYKMGTLLRDKFSFTKLEGIRDAYTAAFFEKNSVSIMQSLNNTRLCLKTDLSRLPVNGLMYAKDSCQGGLRHVASLPHGWGMGSDCGFVSAPCENRTSARGSSQSRRWHRLDFANRGAVARFAIRVREMADRV